MNNTKDRTYLNCQIDSRGIATLTLNRVEKHNAFNIEVIEALIESIETLAQDPSVRCLVLKGNGKHFSAGADLTWMKSMASKTEQENRQDASRLAHLMHCLDSFPRPTLSMVHGCAFGGALGLICCCDIALADDSALFCLSEVKLGLVPATIAPYVNRTIGARQSRRYMLTAERFDAERAREMGLVHEIVTTEQMNDCREAIIAHLLTNSPIAMEKTKHLIQECESKPLDDNLIEFTSELIAKVRVSEQGQEGLSAFFDKRSPSWVNEEPS
ncbi:enoyl-CoA hydratase/isomerase family protein [Vibrio pectenicida]|uniref:enoyl-CoA hydratase/isomerase family protein n=1 Tax=Vibrio pectenicida TaxID=62763 RepID=UPI003B9AADB1